MSRVRPERHTHNRSRHLGHLPDVLEMPYLLDFRSAGEPGALAHAYRLGGMTCLAGDVIGEFDTARRTADYPIFLGSEIEQADPAEALFHVLPVPMSWSSRRFRGFTPTTSPPRCWSTR